MFVSRPDQVRDDPLHHGLTESDPLVAWVHHNAKITALNSRPRWPARTPPAPPTPPPSCAPVPPGSGRSRPGKPTVAKTPFTAPGPAPPPGGEQRSPGRRGDGDVGRGGGGGGGRKEGEGVHVGVWSVRWRDGERCDL